MSDNSDGNVELVERFIAALDVSDTETMDGMIHDDFYFEMPFAPDLLPRLHVGREKSIAFFKSMDAWWDRANFKDLKVDVIGGDEGRLVATYRSETVYASTGTQYRNSYISLFFRDRRKAVVHEGTFRSDRADRRSRRQRQSAVDAGLMAPCGSRLTSRLG